jgi:transcriptional regulator of NAD metabolism
MLTKVQPSAMEIDMNAPSFIEAKRHVIIMDRATLLDKGIHILDLDRFMWIQMKQNYDKHVERMEN